MWQSAKPRRHFARSIQAGRCFFVGEMEVEVKVMLRQDAAWYSLVAPWSDMGVCIRVILRPLLKSLCRTMSWGLTRNADRSSYEVVQGIRCYMPGARGPLIYSQMQVDFTPPIYTKRCLGQNVRET